MATLGRETLGPFGSACEAYEAAEEAKPKLCMTVEELEVFMTREWKIRKGQRRDEIQHFCWYEATISSTALADITGTVAAVSHRLCAQRRWHRDRPSAQLRPPLRRRQSQRVSRATRSRHCGSRRERGTAAAAWEGRGCAMRSTTWTELCVMFTSSGGCSIIASGHCAGRRGPAEGHRRPRAGLPRVHSCPPDRASFEKRLSV